MRTRARHWLFMLVFSALYAGVSPCAFAQQSLDHENAGLENSVAGQERDTEDASHQEADLVASRSNKPPSMSEAELFAFFLEASDEELDFLLRSDSEPDGDAFLKGDLF